MLSSKIIYGKTGTMNVFNAFSSDIFVVLGYMNAEKLIGKTTLL